MDKGNSCPACGRVMAAGEAPHTMVSRIVRPYMTYANVKALNPVDVCILDIDHSSTLKGTMSIEEYQAFRAPKVPKLAPGAKTSVQMAAEYMEISRQAYERMKASETAKKQAELDRARQLIKETDG